MGLTNNSVGKNASGAALVIQKRDESDRVIALAGNPNVGKSTVFNALTGMRQHTGNWPGKTVASAQGHCTYNGNGYVLVDIPGCYSLMAHSAEEEVARDFICFGEPDAVIVVCDACCIERNMNLVLQTLEITGNVVVCVNLMDEARRKGVSPDLEELSARLGVPVVGASARAGEGLDELMQALSGVLEGEKRPPRRIRYIRAIEQAVSTLEPELERVCAGRLPVRWTALRLLDDDAPLLEALGGFLKCDIMSQGKLPELLGMAKATLEREGVTLQTLRDRIVSCIVLAAEEICAGIAPCANAKRCERDRKIDRFLTSKWTGFPVMCALLAGVFWLTITGANVPSQMLSGAFGWMEQQLAGWFVAAGAPLWLKGLLVEGAFRVLGWVVSVMLPPMAIFFPIFTLLEDLGYLPRVAFNLDRYFKKCNACGKQALTM